MTIKKPGTLSSPDDKTASCCDDAACTSSIQTQTFQPLPTMPRKMAISAIQQQPLQKKMPAAISSLTTCCTDGNCNVLSHQSTQGSSLLMSQVSHITPLSPVLKTGLAVRRTKFQDLQQTASHQDNGCASQKCSAGQATISLLISRTEGMAAVVEYEVAGMDCPACAITIEKNLGQLTGVSNAQVNFSLGRMQVFIESANLKPQIEQNVQKLGFRLSEINKPTDTDEYDIQGMDCGACALTIEKHLKKHPQVQEVSVSFASGKMQIRHHLSPGDIIKEVKKAGYLAEHVTSERPLDEISARLFFWYGERHCIRHCSGDRLCFFPVGGVSIFCDGFFHSFHFGGWT